MATSVQLPLNSKRLTTNYLRRLATEVGVPTTASGDELWQMIDGKLSENGHDAPNVQVVLPSTDPSCEFSLEDEEGRFLTVPAAVPERDGSNSSGDSEEEREQDDTHSGHELDDLRVENQSLKDELTNLQQKLEEKTRFRDLWRTNCQLMPRRI